MKVVVLADSHLRDVHGGTRPDALWEELRSTDVILHAVLGNNDHALRGQLPETVQFDLGGVQVAMIHDSGPRAGVRSQPHPVGCNRGRGTAPVQPGLGDPAAQPAAGGVVTVAS